MSEQRIYTTRDGESIYLSKAQTIPECNFIGREEELRLCRAAFGVDENNRFSLKMNPLHFRLEGPPGVGKNEIVYQLARDLAETEGLPFYSIQGHEEMTPEDLSILVVPDANDPNGENWDRVPLRLRASPLATALIEGGIFFFDEINRVPERALSPLASVLDDRRWLYSAMTGIIIEPRNKECRERFRFCCALNPSLGQTGRGTLPDYISERTLPALPVDYLELDDLKAVIAKNVTGDEEILKGFDDWYRQKARRELSVRQAMSIVSWAMNAFEGISNTVTSMDHAEAHILNPEERELL